MEGISLENILPTELRIRRPAERFLRKIQIKDKILFNLYRKALNEIKNYPKIGSVKKYCLHGIRGYDIYHNKINYEIAYTIEKINRSKVVIVVIMAGTRENFYDELKNYVKTM